MSQAENLLNSLTGDQLNMYSVDSSTEEHIVVGQDRYIVVPDALKRIAVQHDHNIETVTFDCPRYWDGEDMSKMIIYINYMRKDRVRGCFIAENVEIDENDESMMHFTWTITRNASEVNGELYFLVCIKKTDKEGNENIHWNSEMNSDMYVSEGLECLEPIVEEYPDVITQLLLRMDNFVEEIEEDTRQYVEEYLSAHPATPEEMQGYINTYMDNNPMVFVIGPNDPGVPCLWLNTGGMSAIEDNIILNMTSKANEPDVYAVVDDGVVSDYDFEIK